MLIHPQEKQKYHVQLLRYASQIESLQEFAPILLAFNHTLESADQLSVERLTFASMFSRKQQGKRIYTLLLILSIGLFHRKSAFIYSIILSLVLQVIF